MRRHPASTAFTSLAFAAAVLLSACGKSPDPAAPKVEPAAPAPETAAAAPEAAAPTGPRDSFKVCWTIYVGWMPWEYGGTEGIVKKWADKYNIKIDVVQINDYVESINQYTAGKFDGCTMTNMDALTIPAAGGVDSTALIVGDFSNGNDGVVIKGKGKKLADIKGLPVNLVELSVSHYLLARALETGGMAERDISVVNTSDADIVGAYATPAVKATVTWNPLLAEVLKTPDATEVFNSSQIPGEIIDLMVVNTQTLKDNPNLGKALTGAWYEILGTMTDKGDAGKKARTHMAEASGTDLAGFDSQLAATKLFATAKEAAEFTSSAALPTTMEKVATFSFKHNLLGEGAKDAGTVGIAFAGDKVYGNKDNVKLRFDPTYMQMAADGKLQ